DGAGGALTLQAGRNVAINANIDTDGGDLLIVANEVASEGVLHNRRDDGAGGITMAEDVVIDADAGTVHLIVRTGAGPGGAGEPSGDIQIEKIQAAHIIIENLGATADSDIERVSGDSLLSASGSITLRVTSTGGDIGGSGSAILIATDVLAVEGQSGGVWI